MLITGKILEGSPKSITTMYLNHVIIGSLKHLLADMKMDVIYKLPAQRVMVGKNKSIIHTSIKPDLAKKTNVVEELSVLIIIMNLIRES